MSAVVADTHAFIWYLFEPTLLSVRAKALFLDLPLITRDRRIQSSTVPSIW